MRRHGKLDIAWPMAWMAKWMWRSRLWHGCFKRYPWWDGKQMAFMSRIWSIWRRILESWVDKTWNMLWNGAASVLQESFADARWIHGEVPRRKSMCHMLQQESYITRDLSKCWLGGLESACLVCFGQFGWASTSRALALYLQQGPVAAVTVEVVATAPAGSCSTSGRTFGEKSVLKNSVIFVQSSFWTRQIWKCLIQQALSPYHNFFSFIESQSEKLPLRKSFGSMLNK